MRFGSIEAAEVYWKELNRRYNDRKKTLPDDYNYLSDRKKAEVRLSIEEYNRILEQQIRMEMEGRLTSSLK